MLKRIGAWKFTLWAAVFAVVAGGLLFYWLHASRLIQVGEVRIDPKAAVNPERQYHLLVWEHEVPLPWDEGSHREALNEAVAEFMQVWPNVTVEVEVLDWYEGHGKLREAIAAGAPPDVYGMPLGVRLIDPDWQVPIESYLSEESASDLLAGARDSVAHDGHLWAWPRWVLPHLWVSREDLTSLLGEGRSHWSAEAFLSVAEDAKAKSGALGLAVNAFDPYLFVDVMVATTGENLVGPEGRRMWTTEEIQQGLAFFKELIDRRLTDLDAERMSRTRLARFWNKQAAMIAPTTPWLLRHLLTRGGVSDQEGELPSDRRHLVLPVPPPSADPGGSAGAVRAVVSGYSVFRQNPYQGDDHTRVAMALAEHLSRRLGPWEAAHLFAVPAHPSSWDGWREDAGLPDKELDLLVEWADASVGPPIVDAYAQQQARAIEDVIAGEFIALWSGADPADLAVRIAAAVDGMRAEVGHP